MSNDELFRAFGMFQEGLQKYATSTAIGDAAEQVRQLNAQTTDEMVKRQRTAEVGNNLALHLSAIGAPSSQIQSTMGAIMPTAFKDAQDVQMQAILKGSPQLAAMGDKLQAQELKAATARADVAGQWDMRKQELTNKGNLDVAMLKDAGKKSGKPLTASEIKLITDYETESSLGTDLLNQVENNPDLVGPVAGRLPGRSMVNPEFAAFESQNNQWFDSYRQRITGAGASTAELKMLQANRPSVKDTPSEYKAKTVKILEVGETVRNRFVKNLGRGGRDVTDFLTAAQERGKPVDETPEEWLAKNPDHPKAEKIRKLLGK